MSSSRKIGIDLGTTYSACGIYKSDRIEIICDANGSHVFESVIYPDVAGKKIVVGSGCKWDINKSKKVVYDSKRFIGLTYENSQFQNDLKRWSFRDRVINDNNIPKVVTDYWNEEKTKKWTAEEVSAAILKEIHDRCCVLMGIPLDTQLEAVITVPAYFTETKRRKTKLAAEMANLAVIQIINEPSAAALAYAYQVIHQNPKSNDFKNILVYDFGGGTFDVSIIKVSLNYQNPTVDVIATEGDSHLGGEDIDEAMVEEFKKRYKQKTNKEMNEKLIVKCRKGCEDAKKLLTIKDNLSATVDVDKLEDLEINELSLQDFNNITNDLIDKTINLTKSVYDKVKSKIEKLDYILLVGGSSIIKSVRVKLQDEFPHTNIMSDIGAQEVVAHGAALLANNRFINIKFNDIITQNIYTRVFENGKDDFYRIIEKNTPLNQAHGEFQCTNYYDDQDIMDADLYEGDVEKNEIDKIGSKSLPISKRRKGECLVEFHVTSDVSGFYKIETKEKMEDGSITTRNIEIEHI